MTIRPASILVAMEMSAAAILVASLTAALPAPPLPAGKETATIQQTTAAETRRELAGVSLTAAASGVLPSVSSPAGTSPRGGTSSTGTATALPTRLTIPRIGVDATLVDITRDSDGDLVPPATLDDAGWYTESAIPGAVGPAVIAGHVDDTSRAGVFARLRELRPGDVISIALDDGRTTRFEVTGVLDVAKSAFPTSVVYGATPDARLRLVTCNSPYDEAAGHYAHNLVVSASLIP